MTEPGPGPAVAGRPDRRPLRERRPSGSVMRFDDAEPCTVVLVRHGETEATLARSLSGSGVPGPALSAAGRVQAAQAADRVFRIGRQEWTDLPHPDAVVASPMVRTQQTAEAIGRRLGARVRVEDAVREADFGAWEGRTPDELEAEVPGALRAWYNDPTVRAPGGESLVDVGDRVSRALGSFVPDNLGHTLVVVSHVMAIRAGVGALLELPARRWGALRVPAASLSIVRLWPDGARELVCLGVPSGR
jgi:probable phosphoglycerate mutase